MQKLGLGLAIVVMLSVGLVLRTTLGDTKSTNPPGTANQGPAKLAVLLVFDQMRGDYVARWQPLFGEGGFKRLMREGVWFDHCHYPYASTMTGPGHASISTGCSPNVHGIVANDWYDLGQAAKVNCVATDRYSLVSGTMLKKGQKPLAGASPDLKLAPSIGDAVKVGTENKGRVFALSIKNRSAILPGGKSPDVCYWFSSDLGQWVTSTYYRDRVHPWVAELNRTNPAEKYFDHVWKRTEGVDFEKYAGPDDVEGEGARSYGFGRTFPHAIVGNKDHTTKSRNEAVLFTPFGNEMRLEAVEKLLDAEKPGSGPVGDLLSVSFSSNDLCGHAFGPDSQEVLDMTLRTDRLIERVLKLLDAKVGAGNYSVALTADHGVCPLPEVSASRGFVARRMDTSLLKKKAVEFLRATYPKAITEKTAPIVFLDNDMVYFDPAWLKKSELEPARVEEKLSAWFRTQPGFVAAFPRSYLKQPPLPGATDIELRVRKSWRPDRCGDIQLVTSPYWLMTTSQTGTSHGTPYDYDRHVPLLVLSPGLVAPGVTRHDPVTPQAAAVVLMKSLGIPAPAMADTPLPAGLFLQKR